ncbi:hypothetical protein LTS10_002890 [Elasticomyces elasticus]|nr:hypothetical protein LTS10_002890 [Elasticomyces elasticus]
MSRSWIVPLDPPPGEGDHKRSLPPSSPAHFTRKVVHFKMDSQLTPTTQNPQDPAAHHESGEFSPNSVINAYLIERVPEYRTLVELRRKASPFCYHQTADLVANKIGTQGWNNPAGDEFFRQQREKADNSRDNLQTAKVFYSMMRNIAHDMHSATHVFDILTTSKEPRTLDFCMAPGGFLETAMKHDGRAQATAFSLDPKDGGHEVFMPQDPKVKIKSLDITMLAEDMEITNVPVDHPDYDNFLPQELFPSQVFDLIFCDGQVLRNHSRADYREGKLGKESTRLTLTQLALGLRYLKPRGVMVVLLHKLEAWNTVQMLWKFSCFAKIQLYKHSKCHAKRSSFYMIASEINSRGPEGCKSYREWRDMWAVATFGTDEEWEAKRRVTQEDVESVLAEFGDELARMALPVWDIQARALEKAPFIKDA